jgi:hypothetical protein
MGIVSVKQAIYSASDIGIQNNFLHLADDLTGLNTTQVLGPQLILAYRASTSALIASEVALKSGTDLLLAAGGDAVLAIKTASKKLKLKEIKDEKLPESAPESAPESSSVSASVSSSSGSASVSVSVSVDKSALEKVVLVPKETIASAKTEIEMATITLKKNTLSLRYASIGFAYWQWGKAFTYFVTVALISISACLLNRWTGGLDTLKKRRSVGYSLSLYILANVVYLVGMIASVMNLWGNYFLGYVIVEALIAPLVFVGLSIYWRVAASKLEKEKLFQLA